jgi:hypothetical protein
MQVSKSEACEFFGITFSLFPFYSKVTLEQAATAVACINVGTRRPKD